MIEYTPEELIELLEWEIKSLQAELARLQQEVA
jgi:hypothetical protein